MDRIDLWIEVGKISSEKLSKEDSGTGKSETEEIQSRVEKARRKQSKRFESEKKSNLHINRDMGAKDLLRLAAVTPKAMSLLAQSAERLGISPRGFHRSIKLARTIADLDDSTNIEEKHILEALQYRPKGQLLGN
jgi:magnesium chelatase family protein